MDPITGLVALTGISLATVAGLRLKKNMEGFQALPDANTGYQASVAESQTRYNKFSRLVNPITNSIIPVGSPDSLAAEKKEDVNASLGNVNIEFSPDSKQTLVLKNFENKFKARSDSDKSLYAAIKFCREAGQGGDPFSAVSENGEFRFDRDCGVCLTEGVDEESTRFRTPQGMLVDPDARDAAIAEKESNGWPYPRIGPAIGTCEGAPGDPVFATTKEDFDRFGARQRCLREKTLGGPDNCALCFESDSVFSSVPPSTQMNIVGFVLQGTGTAKLEARGIKFGEINLSESSASRIDLKDIKEGDTFLLNVDEVPGSTTVTNVYGYIFGKTPRDGLFTMPLNLIATIDDETGASPSKSGGFHNFEDIGLDVAKMRPGAGRSRMRLRGIVPFSFVQPNELAAMDCLDGPYQKQSGSASAFATDQPCFVRGAKPGKYNDDCLRERILGVGCTNAGTLFKSPQQLNTRAGAIQTLTQIYRTLQGVADLDMVEPEMTKMCSGREIQTPCDPFIARESLKFGAALMSSNKLLANQAQQCLSFLYNNKGANESAIPPRVGPTYVNPRTYSNDQKDVKNIFCLPEGELNPDRSQKGRDTLTRIADNGYKGQFSVWALKQYLSDQLSLAADVTRNGNSDPERRAAITNCFGANLKNLPTSATGSPTIIANPCGVVAQYVRVLPSTYYGDAYIEISQLVVIDKNGQNVAPGKSTAGSSPPFQPHGHGTHEASFAIDGQMYAKAQNFYISQGAGGNNQFLLNLGTPTDITKIIYFTRGDNKTSWYRKNGVRLQLLDSNQRVVDQKVLDSSLRQEIVYLQQGADPSCKSELPAPLPMTLPAGYRQGVYVRFYDILDPNPDITPGNRGWGDRMGTPGAYGRILFNDWNIARHDRTGVVIKGYYVAPGPETLYIITDSDDGIFVSFDNRQVIRNWTIHGPTRDTSAAIPIPKAGVYPFELRFYEWGGGALCNMYYRINDESQWTNDLSRRFAYNPDEITREDQAYQAILASRRAVSLNPLSRPLQNTRIGTAQMTGDYVLSMTITARGTTGDWANIIRFAIAGGNCCDLGSRSPAIWFFPGATNLHVIIGDARDGNWGIWDAGRCPIGVATNFRLECRGDIVSVTLAGNTRQVRQPSMRAKGNATVFMSDPYYPAAICDISNFSFQSFN
jgi:hypothetical protein